MIHRNSLCAAVLRCALLAMGLVLPLACRSMPDRPPVGLLAVCETPRVSVHAATQQRAQSIARTVEEAFAIAETLPRARRHGHAIVYVHEGALRAWTGVTRVDGWIEITTGDEDLGSRFIVAHELAHSLLEPDWDPLPQVLEEGLCDALACRFDPPQAARQRADIALHLAAASGGSLVTLAPPLLDPRAAPIPTRIGVHLDLEELPSLEAALRLEAADLARLDEGLRTALYGLGFVIVEAIGTDALLAMCQQARLAGASQLEPREVLARAGIDPAGGWNLIRQSGALLGESEQSVLRESILRRRTENPPR